MIHVSLSLSNPFVTTDYNCLWNRYGKITKNKTWELQFSRSKGHLISLSFSLSFRQSHSGPSIGFGLLGYTFDADIYDNRHWNYEKDEWAMPPESGC